MAKLSSKDQLKRYRTRLLTSKSWREQEGFDDLWDRLIDLYRGKHFGSDLSSEDRIAINVSFATINVIYPSISVNHPKTTVLARKAEDNDRAILAEAVLDYWWRNLGIHPELRLAVKDYLMVGHGWLKTGWRFQEKQQELSEEERQSALEEQLGQLDQMAEEDPSMAHELPTDEQVAEFLPVAQSVVVKDEPFVERCSPHDIYVDPEATRMTDLRWIAQKVVRPLEDVRDDHRYDVRARNKVKADQTVKKAYLSDVAAKDDDTKRVTLWEMYDLKSGTVSVFADQGDDTFLVKPQKMPYECGHPFIMVRNYEVPEHFYPMGDLECIEPLQHELNKTRSQLMNARKSYVRKYLAKSELLDATARTALESDIDGEIVEISGGDNFNLADVIIPAPIQPVPADLFNYSQAIESDITDVSGVSDYQRGSAPEIRRTATEASMIQDATNARSADKLAHIEMCVATIGKHLLELARQYLTGEQTARIVGKEGQPIWVPYDQDDLDAAFDFEVEGGSTQPKNEQWKQQNAMQLLQAVGPLIGQVIDPTELARFVLESFGVKTPERFLMQPPPMGMPPGGPEGPGGPMPPPPPPGMEMPPQEMPTGPAPDGMGGGPSLDQIPPEILAQLAGQIGLTL